MAMMISNEYRLPTVRISIRPSRRGSSVRFQCFHGSDQLVSRDVVARDLGIIEELTVTAYRYAEFQIPENVLADIAGAMASCRTGDEPLWLIVDSSGYLAVVPWEQLLQPALGGPVLRVPNFLADPMRLSGPLRLALCLSSPIAKTPFDIPPYACALVQAIRRAVPQGTRVHVFSDGQVYSGLRDALPTDTAQHTLELHDPKRAEDFGIGDVDRSLSVAADHLKSPWLLWMHSELADGIDAAHFVCPGYFRRDRGALALARSPLRNIDPEWAHFVGAEEIKSFLQLVGAWSVMFSPPYENVWSIGTRVVAGSLAWQRPGPVLLHDIHRPGEFGEDELEQTYRFLFAGTDTAPPSSPGIMLYVHPKRVTQYRGRVGFESTANTGVPDKLARGAESLLPRSRSSTPSIAGPSQPAWLQAAEMQMQQVMLRLKESDRPTSQGIADALGQLSEILDRDRS